jgi:hypothetical protein
VPAEGGGHVDAQPSLGAFPAMADGLVGGVQLGDDAAAVPQVLEAGLGKGHPPGSAAQQPGAQVALQPRDVVADDRSRQLQVVGGLRERAALGDAQEHPDGCKLVHTYYLTLSINVFAISLFFRITVSTNVLPTARRPLEFAMFLFNRPLSGSLTALFLVGGAVLLFA